MSEPQSQSPEDIVKVRALNTAGSQFPYAVEPSLKKRPGYTDLETHKKRRILACERCRQVKVRCEFDQDSGICKRCYRLRIECSLTDEQGPRLHQEGINSTPSRPGGGVESLTRRLDRHESLLQGLREEIHGLVTHIRGDIGPPPAAIAPIGASEHHGRRRRREDDDQSSSGFDAEKDWYEQPGFAADAATDQAPVSIMRRQNPSNSGIRRLLDATDDIVLQGFVSEEEASRLEQIFLRRSGPYLQLENWNAFDAPNSSIRAKSSLLFAVCCLQGGRLDPDFNDSAQHIQLYEHVRKLIQRLFLISPLPTDVCLAFLIMAMWSNAPKEISEYTDSWLLSGYTAQQEMLNVSFTKLVASMRSGTAGPLDILALRMWNSTCLCNLQFALGTGRPSTIARRYFDQARTIMDSFEASAYDGYELASIALLLLTEDLLSKEVFTKYDRAQRALSRWKTQWNHLFSNPDQRFCCFRFTYHFCQLVVAQRALHEAREGASVGAANQGHRNSAAGTSFAGDEPSSSSSPTATTATAALGAGGTAAQDARLLELWTAMSSQNALDLIRTFASLPSEVVFEFPDFFYLASVYGMMVAAKIIMTPRPPPLNAISGTVSGISSAGGGLDAGSASGPDYSIDLFAVLQDIIERRSSLGRMKGFDHTIADLDRMLDTKDAVMDDALASGSASRYSTVQSIYERWIIPDLGAGFLGAVFNEMLPQFGAEFGGEL